MKSKVLPCYILGIFIINIVTISGGVISIYRLSKWTKHTIRDQIKGDFPLNTSHADAEMKTFEAVNEMEIDRTVDIMTVITEVNISTTLLSILTCMMLLCVASTSVEINAQRKNPILAYIIWNIISIIYNLITIGFIYLDLTTYGEQLFDITICMIATASLEMIFTIFTICYYSYLQKTKQEKELLTARLPLTDNISLDDEHLTCDNHLLNGGDTMLIEMKPKLNIY